RLLSPARPHRDGEGAARRRVPGAREARAAAAAGARGLDGAPLAGPAAARRVPRPPPERARRRGPALAAAARGGGPGGRGRRDAAGVWVQAASTKRWSA